MQFWVWICFCICHVLPQSYFMVAAKPGLWQYHSEVLTDQSPQEICTNIIREKLLEYLPQEVPYSMTQVTNEAALSEILRSHVIVSWQQTDSIRYISLHWFWGLFVAISWHMSLTHLLVPASVCLSRVFCKYLRGLFFFCIISNSNIFAFVFWVIFVVWSDLLLLQYSWIWVEVRWNRVTEQRQLQ